jgi:hypothetical protein
MGALGDGEAENRLSDLVIDYYTVLVEHMDK